MSQPSQQPFIPVVLSGGVGSRLWPVSRASFPKQFGDLFGEALLTRTLRRLEPLGEPRVVAVAATAELTRRALADAGLPAARAAFEPVGRNTAPAVALACRILLAEGRGDAIVGTFPADHLIADADRFERAVRLAARVAADGPVVTLGIRPTGPDTGYGYIELAGDGGALAEDGDLAAHATRGFTEKPDADTARRYVDSGRFVWNAGMFIFRVDAMAAAFERLLPEIWRPLTKLDGDLANLAEIYRELPAVSIDHGVMEHLDDLATVPCDMGWSDVGSWDEVARIDGASGETAAQVVTIEARDNFVRPHGDRLYALVGVEDLVVVDTADALLIARRGDTQRVKEVVAELERSGRRQGSEHVFEHRPWGSFEVLRDTDRFKSKILRVHPHQRLSYQSHRHRAEHWVIVVGHPEVTIDEQVMKLGPGDHVHIPLGARHRIANPTDEPVELVEVQLGDYFGEDDIVRYQDDYSRE